MATPTNSTMSASGLLARRANRPNLNFIISPTIRDGILGAISHETDSPPVSPSKVPPYRGLDSFIVISSSTMFYSALKKAMGALSQRLQMNPAATPILIRVFATKPAMEQGFGQDFNEIISISRRLKFNVNILNSFHLSDAAKLRIWKEDVERAERARANEPLMATMRWLQVEKAAFSLPADPSNHLMPIYGLMSEEFEVFYRSHLLHSDWPAKVESAIDLPRRRARKPKSKYTRRKDLRGEMPPKENP